MTRSHHERDDEVEHHGPPPRRVGDVLDQVVRGLGAPGTAALAAVFGEWDHVAGDRLAPHARPVALRGDVLVVVVDDPVWATELRYRQIELLDRLADRLSERRVVRVEVRVEPPSG